MKMKLMIAIPTTDYMHASFVQSLIRLVSWLKEKHVDHTVELVAGTLVYLARDKLARKAVNDGYTHVLWLDSDMVFGDEIVEDLTFINQDFVCGAFQARRPPYNSCVFKTLKPQERVKDYGLEPFRVEGCGMACTLVSTEIMKAVLMQFGTCFVPMEDFGEDLAFCVRARKLGYQIWCDPTVRVGHIAHVPIWPGEEPAK